MSSILVTGSLGTLGRPLVRALRKRGHSVTGLDIRHFSDDDFVRCDVSNFRQLERVFNEMPRFDYVYHLAAEFGRNNGEDYYEQLWTTNVIGTKHMLTLQKLGAYDRLIFASSSEIYGEKSKPILPEDLPLKEPLFHHNDYAISKWVNEGQIRNHIARTGKEVLVLRFFNAYGPGEYYHPYRSVVCLFCYHALRREPFTVYRGYHRVFMYIDDFISTLATTSERFVAGETVNIGGREYRSVEDLAQIVIRECGGNSDLLRYEDFEKHNTVSKRPDIQKAMDLFGHDPKIELGEGVKRTVAWMREVYAGDL